MSSYQTVTLTHVEADRLTLEVVEFNPDQDVLSRLVEEGAIPEEHAHDARKAVAMMLCEYDNYDNAITADATVNGWGFDDGDEIVADVEVTALKVIGTSNNDTPRYKATLVVTLANEAHADSFQPGTTWDTAADSDGDLDEYFG